MARPAIQREAGTETMRSMRRIKDDGDNMRERVAALEVVVLRLQTEVTELEQRIAALEP